MSEQVEAAKNACECWRRERQVCNICQGVTGEVTPPSPQQEISLRTIEEIETHVKKVWPGARLLQSMATDDSGYEGWAYWVDGIPYRMRAKFGSKKQAWLEAEKNIQRAGISGELKSCLVEAKDKVSQWEPWQITNNDPEGEPKPANAFTEPLEKGWLGTVLDDVRLKTQVQAKLNAMSEEELKAFVQPKQTFEEWKQATHPRVDRVTTIFMHEVWHAAKGTR